MPKEMSEQKYLTEADIDIIAERAADKALEKVYQEIGKSVVKKALYLIGIGSMAVLFVLAGKDILK